MRADIVEVAHVVADNLPLKIKIFMIGENRPEQVTKIPTFYFATENILSEVFVNKRCFTDLAR